MSVTIALDAMGGDDAPAIVIDGAVQALRRAPDLRFTLFGDEEKLAALVKAQPLLGGRSEIVHTPEWVKSDAKPSVALRQGRRTSMRLAIDAVKDGAASAAVSAGNTGALMAMAKVVLKTLPGIDRPALASVMPARQRDVVILDLGANVQCDADALFSFAVMGEVAARTVLGVKRPTVGLLNVGTEEIKGDDIVRAAAAKIRASNMPIDFAGFVEGMDITDGKVDVVVTDGFTGNVALKVAEGTAALFTSTIREALNASLLAKLGYLLSRSAFQKVRAKLDPRVHNGAMFLGVNGVVVKSHGGTDGLGFGHAIGVASNLVRSRANDRIIEEMRTVSATLDRTPQAATG